MFNRHPIVQLIKTDKRSTWRVILEGQHTPSSVNTYVSEEQLRSTGTTLGLTEDDKKQDMIVISMIKNINGNSQVNLVTTSFCEQVICMQSAH